MKNKEKFDKIIIGDNMESKIFNYVISFFLCIILFVVEVLLMIQYNLSKGIKKQDVIRIIDNIEIEEKIQDMDDYYKLEDILGEETVKEIASSEELNAYIKENAKAIYLKTIYGEDLNYASSLELREYINNKIGQLRELNEITEEQEIEASNIIDTIIEKAENDIEESINFDKQHIIEKIMSNKTTTYLFLTTILLTAGIILLNRSKAGLIFTGIPTIIVGVIFLILELGLTQKINATGIDKDVMYIINTYLPNLIKTLKKTSLMMTIIGAIECGLYTVLNYQEVGSSNGEI